MLAGGDGILHSRVRLSVYGWNAWVSGAGQHLPGQRNTAEGDCLYIPANLLPITLTTALGNTEGDTIMQGVIYFMQHGDIPVALVIFTASILVPVLKIAALTYLLVSVQQNSSKRALDRTRIFRIVEFVGRWSMIDVFVVSIMVALVQLRAVATIQAGPGAIYFCAVVIITMLAAESFDPRLIWDRCESDD